MERRVRNKLLEINQVFYESFAQSFSVTRHQVQPGVRQVIDHIKPNAAVLDVGCGNGTLAQALAARGFSGHYLGLDMSASLLNKAETLIGDPPTGDYAFQQVDLSAANWQNDLHPGLYDWLVSFAVLHHLPGDDLRLQTALAFHELINPDGYVAVSVWQWHNSPRLRKRVQPWSTVGINPEALEDGDVLLDWRAGETPGVRYVHTFTEGSLSNLAERAGFQVWERFYSDGKTGDLALYQIWQQQHRSKKPAD
jgi:tRNA (uracil-5-)-methyltransferase TRM9